METRKVQRLGPSTLAMTLPAEWAQQHGVEKGDEVSLRISGKGTLTVLPESAHDDESEATIHTEELDADAVERAIVAQYVLGRRVIHVVSEETLESSHINAVYNAETQLMGLGVIEETPESIAIRCSVDPEDFDLDNLLERLENTGSTMRGEAVKALAHGNADLAQRALNRERQANKIFVLLLRLIFTAHENPAIARAIGLESGFPLIGYRSIAKNLELTADNAEDIADIVLAANGHSLEVDSSTMRRIREFTDQVDEMTALAVQASVERDYDKTLEVRRKFHELGDRESDILSDLPEMSNDDLLQIRDVLVSLQHTAQYAMRNAEIAANLALNEESRHTTIN
ncbi:MULTISPECIES: phosphate uptake regulator PhoU [unclassified Haladaptatus]|uniref:phosphate signaling complex PhoU family protein n=1 Tax=unclassified Haladaptatus TaxID=2622732 RepID=UPI00209BDBE1|nr:MULTISPECIES: phosphate uptake regulator PhoU [unclassified Haladaptatus]MCO8245103.1 phosphate uptake regulator PhoU [Haladaptatus sp. AB643]MCO8253246.1 phosphate uptake regulator PhoU [Haladaptatus sp. AB618]